MPPKSGTSDVTHRRKEHLFPGEGTGGALPVSRMAGRHCSAHGLRGVSSRWGGGDPAHAGAGLGWAPCFTACSPPPARVVCVHTRRCLDSLSLLMISLCSASSPRLPLVVARSERRLCVRPSGISVVTVRSAAGVSDSPSSEVTDRPTGDVPARAPSFLRPPASDAQASPWVLRAGSVCAEAATGSLFLSVPFGKRHRFTAWHLSVVEKS